MSKSIHPNLKTIISEIDNTKYQAMVGINGILIDPVLPNNFWTEPLETRSADHIRHWKGMPFIISEDNFYKTYCLDGDAWDKTVGQGAYPVASLFMIGKGQ